MNYIERLKEELEELELKISKLESFFKTDLYKGLIKEQRELLKEQFYTMKKYEEILIKRLNLIQE